MYDMSELELIECEIVVQKLIKHYKNKQDVERRNRRVYSDFQKSLETIRGDIKGELSDRVGAYDV